MLFFEEVLGPTTNGSMATRMKFVKNIQSDVKTVRKRITLQT